MKWVCPHCQTSLETPQSTDQSQEDWAYVRCLECKGFAEIEVATGAAQAILREKRIATPPPFRHALHPQAAPAVVPPAPPLPSFEHIIQTMSPEMMAKPFQDASVSRSRGFQSIVIGGVVVSALLFASGIALWTTRSPTVRSPLERSHAAAQKVTAPIPAAPLMPPTAQVRLATNSEISDSIRSEAMAPRRPTPEEIQLYLQARKTTRTMELRTGPGTEYPLFGLADLDERYPVLEVKNRWFKVQLEETPGLTAWVAYERVELFSKDQGDAPNGESP